MTCRCPPRKSRRLIKTAIPDAVDRTDRARRRQRPLGRDGEVGSLPRPYPRAAASDGQRRIRRAARRRAARAGADDERLKINLCRRRLERRVKRNLEFRLREMSDTNSRIKKRDRQRRRRALHERHAAGAAMRLLHAGRADSQSPRRALQERSMCSPTARSARASRPIRNWPTIPAALCEERIHRRLRHHPRNVPVGRAGPLFDKEGVPHAQPSKA